MGKESSGDASQLASSVEWKRVSEVFDDSYTMWGSNGIQVRDMKQGGIGNCWYIAAAAALAEYPERLDKVVENDNTINEAGIYAFNMYAVGVPITVVIDDKLPLMETFNGGYRTVIAHVGDDKALWGPLMEKAFAKLHGNYEHLVGGWMSYGVSALNGSPHESVWHNELKSKEHIWKYIKSHDDDRNILTAGLLPPAGSSCYEEHPVGL